MTSYAVTLRAIAKEKNWVKVVASEAVQVENIGAAIDHVMKGSPITPEGRDGIIYDVRVEIIK